MDLKVPRSKEVVVAMTLLLTPFGLSAQSASPAANPPGGSLMIEQASVSPAEDYPEGASPGQPEIDFELNEPPRKDWAFALGAYGWLASVEGTTVANGDQTPTFTIPFDDILNNVDFGFQLYAALQWRRLYVAFDGTWVTLGGEDSGSLYSLDIDIDQRIFDFRVGYELYRHTLDSRELAGTKRHVRDASVSVYLGARYSSTDISVEGTIGRRPFRYEAPDDRWDPLIGLHGSYDVTRWLGVYVRGDIGGFGLGEAAQFTWQAEGGVRARVVGPVGVVLGYGALGFDTVSGGSGADLIQHGPVIGAGVAF